MQVGQQYLLFWSIVAEWLVPIRSMGVYSENPILHSKTNYTTHYYYCCACQNRNPLPLMFPMLVVNFISGQVRKLWRRGLRLKFYRFVLPGRK